MNHFIDRIRWHPRRGDRLVSSSGRELTVVDLWQEGRENEVVVTILRVPGKGEQEKFFSISKWRALIDWPDVVSAEEGS